MAQLRWARLASEYPCPLRRGAWYKVVSTSPTEVTVDVNRKPVRIPRRTVELVEEPVTRWTVVEIVMASAKAPKRLGTRYGVCPSCRERVPLTGQETNIRCPKCNGLFEVAWPTGRPAAVSSGTPVTAAPSPARAPRQSMGSIPRKRGPDRRKADRREKQTPVPTERRSGSERRRGERRKKGH